MAKKAAPSKKPEKVVNVSTVMDAKNRVSSKINYDALDKLNEELGYAPAFEEGTKSNCGSHGDMQLSNEKNNRDDKFEHEGSGYSEEAEARQAQDYNSYVENYEFNGYIYDDEYNYDEESIFDEL